MIHRTLIGTISLFLLSATAGAESPADSFAYVDVSIDGDGRVTDAVVVGAPIYLEGPLQEWVGSVAFEPARIGGKAVSSSNSVTVSYSLVPVDDGYQLEVTDYSQGPRPLEQKAPKYPRINLDIRRQGWVLGELAVAPSGKVTDVRVLESSHPSFEKAAIHAWRKWNFKAPTVDGEAVASTVEQRIEFALE